MASCMPVRLYVNVNTNLVCMCRERYFARAEILHLLLDVMGDALLVFR